MSAILQRLNWNGVPQLQGETIRLTKGERESTCELWSHQFAGSCSPGGEMLRTQVCRSQEDVLSTTEEWRAALIEKGWV